MVFLTWIQSHLRPCHQTLGRLPRPGWELRIHLRDLSPAIEPVFLTVRLTLSLARSFYVGI